MKTTKILNVTTDDRMLLKEIAGIEVYKDTHPLKEHIYSADLDSIPQEMTVKSQQKLVNIMQLCARHKCDYFRFVKRVLAILSLVVGLSSCIHRNTGKRLCDGRQRESLIIKRDVSGGYCKTDVSCCFFLIDYQQFRK